MEQLFFAGKAYLKINSLVKTPLHEFMAVERSGLWAPGLSSILCLSFVCTRVFRQYSELEQIIFIGKPLQERFLIFRAFILNT